MGDKVAPEQGLPILWVDTSERGLYPSLQTEHSPSRDLFISIFDRNNVGPLLRWGVGDCVRAIPVVHYIHWLHEA